MSAPADKSLTVMNIAFILKLALMIGHFWVVIGI